MSSAEALRLECRRVDTRFDRTLEARPSIAAGFLLAGQNGVRRGEHCMDIFIQQIINGLVLGSVYALVALGYTMVYGIINLINFAHGEVLMVGALCSWS